MSLQRPSAKQLQSWIAELIVSGAMYKQLSYDHTDSHFEDSGSYTSQRVATLPKNLRMYCNGPSCEQETIWEVSDPTVYVSARTFHHATYSCRNCGNRHYNYWFLWIETQNVATFVKVGQHPPLAIEPSPELARSLGKEDTALYKKALINGNFAFGLGALAYFRRVIENKVNMLIDLIGEAAKLVHYEEEELTRIEEVKANHHLDARIEYASKILPHHLRPGGHNPLNKLYAAASAGIHGKSDEECLNDFQAARFEFEYLFKNLTVSNEEAREYLKRLSAGQPKKS